MEMADRRGHHPGLRLHELSVRALRSQLPQPSLPQRPRHRHGLWHSRPCGGWRHRAQLRHGVHLEPGRPLRLRAVRGDGPCRRLHHAVWPSLRLGGGRRGPGRQGHRHRLRGFNRELDRTPCALRDRHRRHAGRPTGLPAPLVIEPAGQTTSLPGSASIPGDNPLMARLKNIAILIVVAIGAFYAGSLAEFQWGGYAPDWTRALLFYTPPKSNVDYRVLDEVLTNIQQHYVKPNPDGVKLTEGAASGMVSGLGDQFSRYLTPDEYRSNQNFLNGQFAGIGASVQQKGEQILIASVLPGTPAEKAGMKAGDVITGVDGQSTAGWTADDAVNHIRGKAGTEVRVQVSRNGQTLNFNLTRQEINVPSVATHVFSNRVLYIRVYDFGSRTATEFEQALRANLKGSVTRIVLDLRDNPGGYVDAANDVISEFVSSGTSTILVPRNGKDEVRSVSGTGRAFGNPLVVLVNENSASASEITAGAIKDHSRGKLVGVKTFGKGSVQEDLPLRNGNGDLHLTIAYWLTPNRHSIEKTGITPDKTVTLPSAQDEYAVDQTPNDFSKDLQLAAALTLLES